MSRASTFVVEHGRYKIVAPCPHCGATDKWTCLPGEFPRCLGCGVIVLVHGRTPAASCATPNGRVDGHRSYVRLTNDGELVCAFCGVA